MKLLRLAPENTKFRFHAVPPRELPHVGGSFDCRRPSVVFVHMNFGIDFAGGTRDGAAREGRFG